MATAADYLQVSTNSITTEYKLRTRSVQSSTVRLTNTSTDQILSVAVNNPNQGVNVTPGQVTLRPGQTSVLTIVYDTGYLEQQAIGISTRNFTLSVSANPTATPTPTPTPSSVSVTPTPTPSSVSVTPTPTKTPTPTPSSVSVTPTPTKTPTPTPPIEYSIEITPQTYTFGTVNETKQYTAIFKINGVVQNGTTFEWSINDSDNAFGIGTTTGAVTSKIYGNHSATVRATVANDSRYRFITGTANALLGAATPTPTPTGTPTPTPTITPTSCPAAGTVLGYSAFPYIPGYPQQYTLSIANGNCEVDYCYSTRTDRCEQLVTTPTPTPTPSSTGGGGGSTGYCGECARNSDCFYTRSGEFDSTRVCDEMTKCCKSGQEFAE